jgi:hypothetical protein
MARVIRNTDPAIVELTTMINDLKAFVVARDRLAVADFISIAADSVGFATPTLDDPGAHNDRSEKTLVAAASTSLATSVTAVNEMLAWYAFHMADTLAHKVVGVALASYTPVSTSLSGAAQLAAAILLANDIKSKYNTHRASTTYHYTADGANPITAADATDQGSLNTLLVELKADLNLHGANGVSAKSVRQVQA